MYDHTFQRRRKHFCRYCLQASSTLEILKAVLSMAKVEREPVSVADMFFFFYFFLRKV